MLDFTLGSKLLDIALVFGIFCTSSLLTYYLSKRYYVLKELGNVITACVILIFSKAFYSYFTRQGDVGKTSSILYWVSVFLFLLLNYRVFKFTASIVRLVLKPNWFDNLQQTAYFLLFSNCVFLIILPYSKVVLILCLLSSLKLIFFFKKSVFTIQTTHLLILKFMNRISDEWTDRRLFLDTADGKVKKLNTFFLDFNHRFHDDKDLSLPLDGLVRKIQDIGKQITDLRPLVDAVISRSERYNKKSDIEAFILLIQEFQERENSNKERMNSNQESLPIAVISDSKTNYTTNLKNEMLLLKNEVYETLLKSLKNKKEHFTKLCDSLLLKSSGLELEESVNSKKADMDLLIERFEKSKEQITHKESSSAQERNADARVWKDDEKQLMLYEESPEYSASEYFLLYIDWIGYACSEYVQIDKEFLACESKYESLTGESSELPESDQL